jgi:hypothetical protein
MFHIDYNIHPEVHDTSYYHVQETHENNSNNSTIEPLLTETNQIILTESNIAESEKLTTNDNKEEANIITNQPTDTLSYGSNLELSKLITAELQNIEDYKILGLLRYKLFPAIKQQISLINLSKNHLAYEQKLLCCHPLLSCNGRSSNDSYLYSILKSLLCCDNKHYDKDFSVLPIYQLALINTDEYNSDYDAFSTSTCNNSKPYFVKKNKLPIQEVSFDEQNSEFIILYKATKLNSNNNKLYLIKSSESIDKTIASKQTNSSEEFIIECPLQKIYSIYYANHNLYVLGQEHNKLMLIFTNINLSKNSQLCSWKNITTLSTKNFNGKAKFSGNGNFIFLLSDNKQLTIFDKEKNWQEINSITNISNFPIDINYNSGRMIFIENNKVLIRNLTSNKKHAFLGHNITTACFIPNSDNFVMFTSEPIMYLVKQSPKCKDKYVIASDTNILHIIKQIYFNPVNSNELIALAEHDDTMLFLILSLFISATAASACLSCCGTCAYFSLCSGQQCSSNSPQEFFCCCCCCCSSEAEQLYQTNSKIGAYAGLSISFIVNFIYFLERFFSVNSYQDKLTYLQNPIHKD